MTVATGALIFCKALREDWDFFYWIMPIKALIIMINEMTIASGHRLKTAEIILAVIRIKIMGSKSCSLIIYLIDLSAFFLNSFAPNFSSLFLLSSSVNPAKDEFSC